MNTYQYPPPKNEDVFEEFCLTLAKEVWSLPKLERYGRRGQRQHGVDLIDLSGQDPLFAFQCKCYDINRALPPEELEAEVNKALGFPRRIGEYIVLTTAKKSTETQNKVRDLNAAHREKNLFGISLYAWDAIERLIDRSPVAKQFLGLEPDDATLRAIRPIEEMLRHEIGDSQHGELNEAKAYLDKGEPADASLILRRIRERSWADLTSGQKSRWCSLEATARFRVGFDKRAAELLIEARTYTPNDEQTMANEIVGWLVLGDHKKAKAIAEDVLERFPHSTAAYAASIELAKSAQEADALISSIPAIIEDAPDILTAIARRRNLGDISERAARRGIELSPEDPRIWLALGNLLLDNEIQKANPTLPGTPQLLSPEKTREAKNAFSKVIELSIKIGHVKLQVEALLRRVVASGLLGEAEEVARDAELALLLAPDNRHVLIAAARVAGDRGDYETAVNTLRRAVMRDGDEETKFFLGMALWNKNGLGDLEEATELLSDIAMGDGPHREFALNLSIEGYLGLGNKDEAAKLIDEVGVTADPALVETLRARVAMVCGDDVKASSYAGSAIGAVSPLTSRATIKKLAKVLMYLGRHGDALPILQEIAVPGVDDEAGHYLVECASRLERYGIALDYCRQARENGSYDEYLRERELQLLIRFDPPTALTFILDLLKQDPTNHIARVNLIVIALRLGQNKLAQEHVPLLPTVTEVDAPEGALVVWIYQTFDQPRSALLYAYDLLRRYFSDHHAHRAFRDAVLHAEREGEPFDTPESIVPGVAVCLSEERTPQTRWIVLEDSSVDASGVDDEVKADSPIATRMLGKRVGEEVVISEGPGIGLTTTVKEIVSKFVFRFRDVLDHWQYRFPEENEMWKIPVGGEDGKFDFGRIFELIEHQRKYRETVEDFYKNNIVPIGAFADLLGTNVVDAIGYIANTEGLPLRCCKGSKEELDDALVAFDNASEVVVELSGFATLLMLEDLQRLGALGKTLILSQSSMLVIRALAAEASTDGRYIGNLYATSGGPQLLSPTDEQKKARAGFFEEILRFAEDRFITLSAPDLAYMDPKERNELEKVIGTAALESAVIASQANRILWTDDAVFILAVRDRLGVRSIWTQAGFGWMLDKGRIEDGVFERTSAKLIGWGYTFARANRAILRAAGMIAEWKRDVWPMKQAIAYLGLPEVRITDAVPLGACLVADAYGGAVLPDMRTGIFLDVLETIARRTDSTEHAFDGFGRLLPFVFGLNVVGREDAVETFAAWRRAGQRGLIRP